MPTSTAHNAPLPVIPEHLRPYLITPAEYLEQHRSENVTHLVVGTVVIGDNKRRKAQARSDSFLSGSFSCDESDGTSCLALASPLSVSSTPSPPLHQDPVFSPSPPSPASSFSSSPPSCSEQSPPPPNKRTGKGKAMISAPALTKQHQSYSVPSPPSHNISLHRPSSTSRRQHQSQKILLVQRSRHDYGGLCWEIPGGSCDPLDASILDAAARELVEEAGLRVRRFVAVVDRQRHEWVDHGEIWRKLTFIVEADDNGAVVDDEGGDDAEQQYGDRAPRLRVRLDPEEHEDFIWASREDLVVGGMGERTFTWIQDEQRQVILRAFDIIEEMEI
ncbi:hypothetical protein PG989_012830 [Apiospora arundinis]